MRHRSRPVLVLKMKRRWPSLAVGLGIIWATALSAAPDARTPEGKIEALGLVLPRTTPPVANYVPAIRTGQLIFLAGQVSRDPSGKVIAGKVGREVSEADAIAAARQTTLGLLATLKREIGTLAKVKRIVRVGGFVNATDDFKNHSQILNGCSDLLVALFGEKGRHARAAVGVASLPLGAVIEIEMVVEVE